MFLIWYMCHIYTYHGLCKVNRVRSAINKQLEIAGNIDSKFLLERSLHKYIYHHLHVALTLSRHPILSSIVPRMSSRIYPVSTQSCCIQVVAGRPAFDRPREGVHRSMWLMSSSLLLQQDPACLVRLILIVFVMGSWQPFSCFFVGCCLQDLFNISRSILV